MAIMGSTLLPLVFSSILIHYTPTIHVFGTTNSFIHVFLWFSLITSSSLLLFQLAPCLKRQSSRSILSLLLSSVACFWLFGGHDHNHQFSLMVACVMFQSMFWITSMKIEGTLTMGESMVISQAISLAVFHALSHCGVDGGVGVVLCITCSSTALLCLTVVPLISHFLPRHTVSSNDSPSPSSSCHHRRIRRKLLCCLV